MCSYKNNECSHISMLIGYINHLKITEQTMMRIKRWDSFCLVLGVSRKMMSLYSHSPNHPTLCGFFLLAVLFLPFLFLLAGRLGPIKWVRREGKVNLFKGIWINTAGETKGTSVYCFESKINRSFGRTQTVVSQRLKDPRWFRGLSNHRKPAQQNTYGWKSVGFLSVRLEFKSTLRRVCLLGQVALLKVCFLFFKTEW